MQRRDFLKTVAAAGTLAALPPRSAPGEPDRSDPLLPTVELGKHKVTRLIVGGNPIYGYSHFNKILSQSMAEWHTPERVLALLKRCE